MKLLAILFVLSLLTTGTPSLFAQTGVLEPVQASPAYQDYLKRPKSELSKLIFLMERFKGTEHKVVISGREYTSAESMPYAKKYLYKNYKGKAKAGKWLKEHSYRTPGSGDIIYVKFSDGTLEVLRDVLVKELENLEKAK